MDDIDIWRVAKLYMDQYGTDAPARAASQAERFAAEGDHAGAAMWRRVGTAIEGLGKVEPGGELQ